MSDKATAQLWTKNIHKSDVLKLVIGRIATKISQKMGPQFAIERFSLHLEQDRGNWHHRPPIDDAAQNRQVLPPLRV
jgi:hypothetical protein